MVSKERDIANKRKREEKSVYNTALAAAIKRFILFIHTGNMAITADELTSAQTQHLYSVEQKKSDIIDKKTAAMLEVKINAES